MTSISQHFTPTFFNHCYFENTGTEPLVTLCYFGPDAQAKAPNVGDHKKKK